MRSFDKSMPEEINRVLTDLCSDYLFCPTQTAVDNLKGEGIIEGIYLTGDVMVDALLYNKEIAERSQILDSLNLESKQYLVATIHRASNTDNKHNLGNIVDALCELDGTIIFPIHPRTEKFLKEYDFYDRLREKVKLTKPLGYLEFLKLLSHAKRVLTDSGGIQKEAYILEVPCIILRDRTEWVETVEDGWNVLVGANKENIINIVNEFEPESKQRFIFEEGTSRRIVKSISE